ncbi:DMT family transporter [Arenibacter sp. BSSL-BM3]|uniref:DMT family transporter n=1 Tax=Arenibacter arenosicollis TaxID=2762274 RepID=A0ABR7QQG8_9FLAO|nr:DMT family transporter [Arenibacter arenosicollis]MBC8769441.1 DMT family transporter [Arenibacter arenosicollis]
MLDLGLSVLFSSLIFVVFKLFDTYKVETLYAIIINYVVASTVGMILYEKNIVLLEIPTKPWFLGTLVLGILFILVFNLMAATSQKSGVSVASVATKMSLVIPVIFGMLVYDEKLGALKSIGIFLALAAVYFASVKERNILIKKNVLILPVLVFIGSGIIDTSIKYLEETLVPKEEFPLFSAVVFGSAAITGIIFIGIKSFRTRSTPSITTALGGIGLGILNYFSIYYLLRALQHENLNSASVFTINNVAIVMFSTLLGVILFKERISIKNWMGITLAVISIFLVAFF